LAEAVLCRLGNEIVKRLVVVLLIPVVFVGCEEVLQILAKDRKG